MTLKTDLVEEERISTKPVSPTIAVQRCVVPDVFVSALLPWGATAGTRSSHPITPGSVELRMLHLAEQPGEHLSCSLVWQSASRYS